MKIIVGKIVICVLIAVVLCVPPIFVNTIIGYLPILFYLFLLLLSFVYVRLLHHFLQFEEISNVRQCTRNTAVQFLVRLQNRSFLPYPHIEVCYYASDLFGNVDTVARSSFVLAPFQQSDYRFSVTFAHIGEYEAGVRQVTLSDPIGLFTATILNDRAYTIEVGPRLFDVNALAVSEMLLTENQDAQLPVSLDGLEYLGVRDYRAGDLMKFIHWKLSARSLSYFTKVFETYGSPGIEILCDFHAPEYSAEELMSINDAIVEAALSIDQYAFENKFETQILFSDAKRRARSFKSFGVVDYRELMSAIPRISTTEYHGEAMRLLAEQVNLIYSYANVAVITSMVDGELVQGVLDAVNRGKQAFVFVIVPESMTAKELQNFVAPLRMLEGTGASYYVLRDAGALEEEALCMA